MASEAKAAEKLVRVRARTRGFIDLGGTALPNRPGEHYDRHPREIQAGEIIDVPESMLANRWLEPVSAEEAAAPVVPTKPAGGKPVI